MFLSVVVSSVCMPSSGITGSYGRSVSSFSFFFFFLGAMHDTGCLGLVHWEDPEGWYGEGGRRGVQDGEHMYTRGGFMYWQNQYNIVK